MWWVKLSHQMSNSVTASLLYGHRNADHIMSPDLVPIGTNADGDPVYATNDPIQVIRAEVSVQF